MRRAPVPESSLDRRVTVQAAGALIHTDDGFYLMQLRDDKSGVAMRGCWGIFGGAIEPGEDPLSAVRRELEEELVILPRRSPKWFTEICYDLTYAKPTPSLHRKWIFTLRVTRDEVTRMRQAEGADMRLFRPAQLRNVKNVVPWDLMAVAMHARRAEIGRIIRGRPA